MSAESVLHEITEIVETNENEQANAYLRAGWVLISTHVMDYGEVGERLERTVYCLGWPRRCGEVARIPE